MTDTPRFSPLSEIEFAIFFAAASVGDAVDRADKHLPDEIVLREKLAHAKQALDDAFDIAKEVYERQKAEDHDKCPVCKGEGEVEGQIGGDGWGVNPASAVADVMLVCQPCGGKGTVDEEKWREICADHGLCMGCGEDEPGPKDFELCYACAADAHADEVYHGRF